MNHHRGVVFQINANFIAKVYFDDGEFSLVEPLGLDLEIGDVLLGNLWELGSCELYDETRDVRFSAFIQDHS